MGKSNAIFLTTSAHNVKRVYADSVLSQLRERYDLCDTILCKQNLDAHLETAQNADYIFSTWGIDHFTVEEIRHYFPKVRCFFYGAGSVQHFAHEFLECGIRVFSAWKANAVPVAEYTHAQILLALKGFFTVINHRTADNPYVMEYAEKVGGIYDAKIGIIGVGCIGRMVVERLRQNDLEVLYYDPFLPEAAAKELGIRPASLEEIFSTCSVISNHLANKDELTGILSAELFDSMKPYSVFINTGRGRQVDEQGLVKAMSKDDTRMALLDVLVHEPLDPHSEIAQCKNILVTPHIAGSLGREVIRMAEYMAAEAKRIDEGEAPLYEVTPEMLKTMA